MNIPMIVAKGIEKTYGELKAVDHVSFEITRGEIFGLLGPNGAGKTTTIGMLTSLTEPTSGEVILDGKHFNGETSYLKSKIGFVPQDLALYGKLSGLDNLIFFGQIYGLRGKHLRERIAVVLEIVGLSDRAKDAVETYSGGMKRRLNIAAGLIHEPEILFLDEPTVGVDPQSRNAIFESVEALNREGMTILYTTHYMEEAERLCHRIAIMDHGKVIALDTPKDLIRGLGGGLLRIGLDNGKFQDVWNRAKALPQVSEIWQHEDELIMQTVEAQKALVDVLAITNQLDARVTSLQILEPNLESVFLQLTGKQLRD